MIWNMSRIPSSPTNLEIQVAPAIAAGRGGDSIHTCSCESFRKAARGGQGRLLERPTGEIVVHGMDSTAACIGGQMKKVSIGI